MEGGALRSRSGAGKNSSLASRVDVQSGLGACRHNPWDKDKRRRSRQLRRWTFARSLLFRGAFPGNFLAEIFGILGIADDLVVRTVTTSIYRQQPRVAGRAEDSNFSHREICNLCGRRPYQHDIATGGFLEIDRNTTASIITGAADCLKCGEPL